MTVEPAGKKLIRLAATVGGGGSLRVHNRRGVAVVGSYANNRLVYLTAMAIGAGFQLASKLISAGRI